jgi:hypothetical protein
MTDLKDILVSGKCGNENLNSKTKEAEQMEAYFTSLFANSSCKAKGVFVNTTVTSATPSEMIPLGEINPKPGPEMEFCYQLGVQSPTFPFNYWSVASWLTAVEVRGLETATRDFMLEVNPSFTYVGCAVTYEGINDTLTNLYASSVKK